MATKISSQNVQFEQIELLHENEFILQRRSKKKQIKKSKRQINLIQFSVRLSDNHDESKIQVDSDKNINYKSSEIRIKSVHMTLPNVEQEIFIVNCRTIRTVRTILPVTTITSLIPNDSFYIRAKNCISQGKGVTKKFDVSDIYLDQNLKPSKTTYWGMIAALKNLADSLTQNGININDICVIGPRYEKYTVIRHNKKNIIKGGDIQPCGGGKLTRIKKLTTTCTFQETFLEGTIEEIKEELRLSVQDLNLYVSSESVFECKQTTTQIFECRAKNCVPIKNFDVDFYSKKNRRGVDIYTKRVGFIVWGYVDECIDLLTKFETNKDNSVLVDKIDAVTIISLLKAIDMVNKASLNLKGTCQNIIFF